MENMHMTIKIKTLTKQADQHTSEGPNKHTLKLPSASSRNLLQPAQKCSVIDVINEIVPTCPSILKFFAVSEGWSLSLSTPSKC
jgi:hypothetical protein